MTEPIGEASRRDGEQGREADLCAGRDEQQMVGAAQKRKQGPAQESAGEEADCEAGDDAREAGLDLLHVEQAPRLTADEDEADLDQHRKQHQERRRHPRTV